MTVILMLCMIVTFLAVDRIVQKVRAARAPGMAGARALPGALPAGVWLAPNHTWVKEEKDAVVVGVDEFIARLAGAVSSVVLPETGAHVSGAQPAFALAHGERRLRFASPVPGRILEVNRKLLDDPAPARLDPYGGGWLMKIAPERRPSAGPLAGESARAWIASQIAAAREFLTGAPGAPAFASLPDGGQLADGALLHCSAEVWREFERRFTAPGAAVPAER